ncbi:MAG: rhodanese-like domain-containing protein [Deltaproteobacteria bacterium]|nr:rhodanese-like domain-containing protein [Deltaproteobacteria bacterium]
MKSTAVKVLLRTLALTVVSSGAALGFNAVRGEAGLALVAEDGFYDNKVFVPCPEVLVEPEAVTPARVLKWNPESLLVVDARDEEEFGAAHHEGAVSLTHSVLFPPDEEELKALVGRAGDRTIVVCGDPEYESGRLLASELMEAGLEQVYFVEGGCAALMGGEMCTGPAR